MADEPRPSRPAAAEPVPVTVAGCPTAAPLVRTVKSADLFAGAKTVMIEHGEEQYRLLLTKNGKLLLQK